MSSRVAGLPTIILGLVMLGIGLNGLILYHPGTTAAVPAAVTVRPTPICCTDMQRWGDTLLTAQSSAHTKYIDSAAIGTSLLEFKLAHTAGFTAATNVERQHLNQRLGSWQRRLDRSTTISYAVNHVPSSATDQPPNLVTLPIVLYHTTPPDFKDQLQVLADRDYTSISFEQAEAAWYDGASLPAKPIIITFDDGLADQMQAFSLLQQYNFKATFYIITGGPASLWCIGANRRYNDPVQPSGGCGDAYLNWDQVRQLDRSGLITIGGHTIDHPDLTSEAPDQQRHEIADGKTEIEHEIGHAIHDFAYPYGYYDSTTEAIVRQAGYDSAVTTDPGVEQDTDNPFQLERIRSTYDLP